MASDADSRGGQWVVVDTQRNVDYRVLCVGTQLKNASSWTRFGTNQVTRQMLGRYMPEAVERRQVLDLVTHPVRSQRWRVVVRPVIGPGGDVHAAIGWVGATGVELPPAPRVGAWLWDITGRHTAWSDDLNDLYGVSPAARKDRYSPEEFFARIDLADHDRLRKLWADVSQNGDDELRIETFRITRDDGTPRMFRLSGRTVVDDEHRPRAFRGISQDITDLPRADKAVPDDDTAVIVRGLAQLSGGAVALVDGAYRQFIHWVTDLPAEIQPPTDGLVADAIHPADHALLEQFFDQLDAGFPATTTLRMRGRNVDWVPVRLSGTAIGAWADGSSRIVTSLQLVDPSTLAAGS